VIRAGLIAAVFLGALLAQRGFRRYYEPALPPDAGEKTEFAFVRLRYSSGGFGRRGWGGGAWATDWPEADRHFVQGIRRLSRIQTRSVEEIVDIDLDNDEIFKYPWVYTLEVGYWNLGDRQIKVLRDYLLRGGFMMIDDFHGEEEWQGFLYTMQRIFPDRPIVDLPESEPVFHVLYDLQNKQQVANVGVARAGYTYERYDGQVPHWRGIYDDKNRLMVAICHNMDYGDAWEWADDPSYPAKMTIEAYQLGINYIIYAMTH
jgi:hypothetical protein